MDFSMQSFKLQIEQMFEKTFQQLNQKNQLNKNILQNLMEAASQQSNEIGQLDNKLQALENDIRISNQEEVNTIKKELKRNEGMVLDNFNLMMQRLQKIEEVIANSRKSIEFNAQNNKEAEGKIDLMINQMENIIARERVPQYKGDRQQLTKQIDEFENILKAQIQKQKSLHENIEFSKKTALQPLNTFQTKMAIHNKVNQQILKDKLFNFTDKLRKLQKKVEETTWIMNTEISKSNQEQRKIIDEMNFLENQMGRLRLQLQSSDQKRKQTMQSHALTLDNMVEEMLSEAKKLEVRVQSLKKGFEEQNEKLKRQVYHQKSVIE